MIQRIKQAMKRLKIFPKTFLYTLVLMLFITMIAHALIYFLLPSLTVSTPNQFNNSFGQIAVTLDVTSFMADRIISLLPYSIFICFLVSVICSFFYSKAITKPIQEISAAAKRMAALEKDAECMIQSGDEIGALAKNINRLYESLLATIRNLEEEIEKVSASEKSKVDFLRAASHELKTPVTAVNAMLENMILGVGKYRNHEIYLPKCKELTEQLGSMIQEVLDASKLSSSAGKEEPETVNLAEHMAALCEPYQMIAKARGIQFYFAAPEAISMKLAPKLFGKAISNLLANAVAYTEPGKSIYIYFQEQMLIIANECDPIPPEHLTHLFEPFYRPAFARDRDSGGNGLGLYIVDTIFKVLQVPYQFLPMENQKGMRFCIALS